MIYGQRTNGGEHGTVLTKREVVRFMLDTLDYTPEKNLSNITILEPAAGEGVFLIEILHRLHKSSKKYAFDFEKSLSNIKAVDIDPKKVEFLKNSVLKEFGELGIKHYEAINDIVITEDFLMTHVDKFDIIIGNPPYVRYDNIPPHLQKKYRRFYSTFRHRADLYIPFFEKGLNILSDTGKLCYICSNRWMKSQYGQKLREMIGKSHGLQLIVNLEDADAFEEQVHAYASVTLITKEGSEQTNYFKTDDIQNLPIIRSIFSGKHSRPDSLQHFILPKPVGSNWILDPEMLEIEKNGYSTLEGQGYTIGIGVATGADSVFIGEDLQKKVEEEVILPVISGKDIVDGNIEWKGKYVINPYNKETGEPVRLSDYPKLKAYLEKHKETLKQRHTAQKNPKKWYKTIDKINTDLKDKPKLILPDIRGSPYIALDDGDYYPHHNVYYILNPEKDNLKLLGAILMSDFVKKQIKSISNLMNGGYPRWQAQNLRKIKIPPLRGLENTLTTELIKAFEEKNIDEINDLTNRITSTAAITPNPYS